MNEYIVAAKITAILAIPTIIISIVIRLILAMHRPSAYSKIDSQCQVSESGQELTKDYKQAATQVMQYTKPTFKKNNSEDDLISRSFKINTVSLFEDDTMDLALHAAGLSNNIFAE